VNYGPHRDVVGEWQKAAKKNGLPFGVSEHLGASFTWFQDAHKSDKTGPFAGVPYDGAIAAPFMGHIADAHSMRTGFVVPLVRFVFIAIYGLIWQKLEVTDIAD
jgi:alpha-L-fucosidase